MAHPTSSLTPKSSQGEAAAVWLQSVWPPRQNCVRRSVRQGAKKRLPRQPPFLSLFPLPAVPERPPGRRERPTDREQPDTAQPAPCATTRPFLKGRKAKGKNG